MAETPAAKAYHSDGNYKETVKSILIAFILAFIFRASLSSKPSVIPTGWMAPTLYGAMRLPLPRLRLCVRWRVQGAATMPRATTSIFLPAPSRHRFHCPNCGYDFPTATSRFVSAIESWCSSIYTYFSRQCDGMSSYSALTNRGRTMCRPIRNRAELHQAACRHRPGKRGDSRGQRLYRPVRRDHAAGT